LRTPWRGGAHTHHLDSSSSFTFFAGSSGLCLAPRPVEAGSAARCRGWLQLRY
jgi:hypothetical protein